MNKSLVSVVLAGLLAVGGYVAGQKEPAIAACPSGYKTEVVGVHPDGPGATVPQPDEHTYYMASVCAKTVRVPDKKLSGGPFDGDHFFATYQYGEWWWVMKWNGTAYEGVADDRGGSNGLLQFENNKTGISVRVRPSYDQPYGPASHYRLSDGKFLSTDTA
jgi:hypothetical protein